MYLTLIQIAESFGVSEKVVDDWIRTEGLPHTPDRGVLLFDRAQVAQWAATRGLAAKAGFLTAESPALASVVTALEPVGTIFIRLITMVVVPIVVASLFTGMASLGDVRRLGRLNDTGNQRQKQGQPSQGSAAEFVHESLICPSAGHAHQPSCASSLSKANSRWSAHSPLIRR